MNTESQWYQYETNLNCMPKAVPCNMCSAKLSQQQPKSVVATNDKCNGAKVIKCGSLVFSVKEEESQQNANSTTISETKEKLATTGHKKLVTRKRRGDHQDFSLAKVAPKS